MKTAARTKRRKKLSLEAHLNDKLLSLYGVKKKPSRLNMSWTFRIEKEREREKQQNISRFCVFVCVWHSLSHFTQASCSFLYALFSCCHRFFSALLALLVMLLFISHCSIFMQFFFLLLSDARPFVSVVFQHPLMALSITFHLFIILLTNSHPHTLLYIYYVFAPSPSSSAAFASSFSISQYSPS